MNRAMRWSVLLGLAACAPHYAYTFQVAPPTADADLSADIVVDAKTKSIALDLTNHTDQVVQVKWDEIAIAGAPLRPYGDLGWIPPGATVATRLFPLVLPDRGDAAAAYEGKHLDLTVPVIVRREAKQYHYSLIAHVREI